MATLVRRSRSTAIPPYTSSASVNRSSTISTSISTGVTNSVSSNSSPSYPTNSPSATSGSLKEVPRSIVVGATVGGAFCGFFFFVLLWWILRNRRRLQCHLLHSPAVPPDLTEELERTVPTPFIVPPKRALLPASPLQSNRFLKPFMRSYDSISTPLTTPAEAHTRRKTRRSRRRERERRPSMSYISFTTSTSTSLDEAEGVKTTAPCCPEKPDLDVERQLEPLRFGSEGGSASTSQKGSRRERTVKHKDSGWRATAASVQVERETSITLEVPPDYTPD
ncbi:hypothetical protein L218DRAFT_1005786 [Marasmius fiardii PR-910]|nr:hypothetical protein L218DRAFT_1005786 [Marasmius fiardii PR-910]